MSKRVLGIIAALFAALGAFTTSADATEPPTAQVKAAMDKLAWLERRMARRRMARESRKRRQSGISGARDHNAAP